ncbi:MAG: methylenetetrahydrofolate reductase [Chloroflexi bacterium]|nr:methylenetetrahydrofolate reductase [Chloroflexota bacterium]
MATVTQVWSEARGRPVIICDFSPPRGADLATVAEVRQVGAELVCVASNPGKSVRVDSAVMTSRVKEAGGPEVVFNLACRDMNRLALQSYLLGAHLLGLENVLVVRGDAFTEQERTLVKEVNDYRPTELILAIKRMNEGVDFRGLKLRRPTAFCVGASIDLSAPDVARQAVLAQEKMEAGADFFLTQAFYEVARAQRFLEAYLRLTGTEFPRPVFYGLQVPTQDGVALSRVPEGIVQQLEQGRPGTDIALELLRTFLANGLAGIYLVPPILKGGRRDYEAARQVLEGIGRASGAQPPARLGPPPAGPTAS